jgi:FkbM family methyltransferase
MKVCLHPQGDLISDKISGKGYWDDCLSVPRQYFANNESRSHGLHIEIGANIGSCIFELLLSDSVVEILAFEPHPRNLFALTSSLKNNPDLGRRVTVFPVALGTVDDQKVTMGIEIPRTSNPIAVNMGTNFVLQDEHSSKTHPKVPRVEVPMERLDTILNEYFHFQIPSIRFMKVDAQGFECNILNGSLPTIMPDRLIFEVEGSMLERAGCSKKGLLSRVGQYYELYRYRASGALDKTGLDNDENINAVGVLRQAFPSAQEREMEKYSLGKFFNRY